MRRSSLVECPYRDGLRSDLLLATNFHRYARSKLTFDSVNRDRHLPVLTVRVPADQYRFARSAMSAEIGYDAEPQCVIG